MARLVQMTHEQCVEMGIPKGSMWQRSLTSWVCLVDARRVKRAKRRMKYDDTRGGGKIPRGT